MKLADTATPLIILYPISAMRLADSSHWLFPWWRGHLALGYGFPIKVLVKICIAESSSFYQHCVLISLCLGSA